MENVICLDVRNLPYKKMNGLLKSLRIDPSKVAIDVSSDFTKYTPFKNWQNYLPFSHKVLSVILYKKQGLYIFVGCSIDNKTINYNQVFSGLLLNSKNTIIVEPKIENKPTTKKRSYFRRSKITRLDILLDKINKHGINSLTIEEKNELENLSKNQN